MARPTDEELQMRFSRLRIQRDDARGLRQARTISKRAARAVSVATGSRAVAFSPTPPHREQRVIVKFRHVHNLPSKSWSAHGSYLSREGAAKAGEKGRGFDFESEDIDLQSTLKSWQEAGDPHVFKMMLSPEFAEKLDMKAFARRVVSQMETDLETRFSWAGIVHINTGHAHVHLVLRGVDEDGNPRRIPKEYIAPGIRRRAQDLVTRELGYRTERDVLSARRLAVERRGFTELDRAILRRAGATNQVSYDGPLPEKTSATEARLFEIQRLHVLSALGFAKKTGLKTWEISSHLESGLRELSVASDVLRSLSRARMVATNPNAPVRLTELREAGQSVTGRVLATGLDDRVEGRRFVVLEGTDGALHYVPQSASIERSRGEGELRVGSLAQLRAYHYESTNRSGVAIAVHDLGRFEGRPNFAVDEEILEFVEQKGLLPTRDETLVGIAAEWRNTVVARATELVQAGVLRRIDLERVVVDDNARSRIDQMRFLETTSVAQPWSAARPKGLHDSPFAGKVVETGLKAVLIEDYLSSFHSVSFDELDSVSTPRRGADVWVQAAPIPRHAMTPSDQRIASAIHSQGFYSPKEHLASLTHDAAFQEWAAAQGVSLSEYVLGHERRARTWVRWGVLEHDGEHDVYRVCSQEKERSVEDAMEKRIGELREALKSEGGVRKALLSYLTPERLEEKPDRFGLVDRVLASLQSIPLESENPVSEMLRERAELWRKRGLNVALDEFEAEARRYLRVLSDARSERTLGEIEEKKGRAVSKVEAAAGEKITGRVVAFATESSGERLVVLEAGGTLRAIGSEKRDLEIGQSIQAQAVGVESQNRRQLQQVWRVDNYENLKQREQGRGRS